MTSGEIVDIIGAGLLSACWLVGYVNYRGHQAARVAQVFFLSATGALLFALLGILVSIILSRSGHDGAALPIEIATGVAGVIVFAWFIAFGFRPKKRLRGDF